MGMEGKELRSNADRKREKKIATKRKRLGKKVERKTRRLRENCKEENVDYQMKWEEEKEEDGTKKRKKGRGKQKQ